MNDISTYCLGGTRIRKKFGIALFALLTSYAIILSLFLGAFPSDSFFPTMPPRLKFNWETLQTNAAPGDSVSINCTVFNTSYNQSAKMGFFILLKAINNESYWSNCSLQKEIFNQTFTPKKLLLGPREQQEVTLTIALASDAPVGIYSFALQGSKNRLKLDVNSNSI